MRKLIVAAAVAAMTTLAAAGRAQAQAFYPGTSRNPTTRGTYDPNYPYGAYPSYPSQYPSTSYPRRDDDDDRDVRRDRQDELSRRSRYDASNRYGQRGGYSGYGTRSSTGSEPSRIGEHGSLNGARGRTQASRRAGNRNDYDRDDR